MNEQILAQNSICAISPVCVFIAYPEELFPMNQTALQFIKQYEDGFYEGAKYTREYGDLRKLYDESTDEFYIEEINEAYAEFKRGSS